MKMFGEGDFFMFKQLTVKEQLQREREKNMQLLNKQVDLENALFELAEILSSEIVEEGDVNG